LIFFYPAQQFLAFALFLNKFIGQLVEVDYEGAEELDLF
jgi:hypothetical protein